MKNLSRILVIGVAGIMILITGLIAVAAQAEGNSNTILWSGLPTPADMVIDSRRNVYTADKKTGYVFCMPPGDDPILLAQVPGTPTTLAVDRLRNVFVGTEDGLIYLVGLDGSVEETYRCESIPIGLDVDRDGGLIIATQKGTIVKVNRSSFHFAK